MHKTYIIKWSEYNENQKKIIDDFNNNNHDGYIYQKYNNLNNIIPEVNDYIIFKVKDRNIMKCRVVWIERPDPGSRIQGQKQNAICNLYD